MKCPNCGFVIQKKSADCIKCGIIFARFKSGRLSRPKVLMASRIPDDAGGIFPALIYPLAIAKLYVEAAYRKILSMLWDELFKGQSELSQTGNFIALVVFSIFSLLMFHIDDYVGYVIAALAAVWILDVRLARHKYRSCRRNEIIRLIKSPQGKIILRKSSQEGEVEYEAELNPAEVNHITLYQAERKGGAFQETVATVWRSCVSFNDGSELLFSEDTDLSRASKKVRYLSTLLRVQFQFKHGQSDEPAARPVRKESTEDGIKVEAKNDRFKVSTRWTSNMRLQFIALILKESGFFLFVLIVAGVMIKFGGLLIFLYERFYGSAMVSVNMQFNFWGILSVFEPDWDVVDIVEYAAAIAFLLRKTLLMARPRLVSIDREFTRHYVNDHPVGECRTAEIENVTLVSGPEPAIIVLDPKSSIEVRGLKSMKEFKAFYQKIRAGIEKFRAAPDKRRINSAPGIDLNAA